MVENCYLLLLIIYPKLPKISKTNSNISKPISNSTEGLFLPDVSLIS